MTSPGAEGPWTIWLCSHCGYASGNRRNWCNAGCGSDYNRMESVEVVDRRVADELADNLLLLAKAADNRERLSDAEFRDEAEKLARAALSRYTEKEGK